MFGSQCLRDVSEVHLTGGEPYLRKDFVEVVRVIHQRLPRAIITWTTNCLLPELIEEKTRKILQVGAKINIGLSLDGDEETHDMVRGIKGNYVKVMKTFERLRELDLNPYFLFTIFPFNAHQIISAYRLAQEKGARVIWGFSRNGVRLNNPNINLDYKKEQKRVVLKQLAELIKQEPSRKTFYYFAKHLFAGNLRFDCHVFPRKVFIGPYGNVYPCDGFYEKLRLGNVRENQLDEIIVSERTQEVRDIIKRKVCQPCTVFCDIIDSISWAKKRKGIWK